MIAGLDREYRLDGSREGVVKLFRLKAVSFGEQAAGE
jgi:hypothetical protein